MTYYIPHHYVTKPNKQNKFRVVFDASPKYAGTSLNDYLLKGPDLLNSSAAVLLRFKSGKYSISADIEKMFQNVKQNERKYLRFIWNRSLTSLSDDYNDLQVLTPKHFLTGKVTKYFGSSEFPRSDINSRKCWKSVQVLANMFWTRFIKEYLPILQERKNGTRLLETSLLTILY